MKNIITYTEEQINQLIALLNGITVTGVQNCKQIAVISQVIESGVKAEIQNSEKKEGD